jgi:hypothetical protein
MSIFSATEPNDSISQADSVRFGDTVVGALSSAADRDYFQLTTTASGILQFNVSAAKLPNWAYTIQIYDASLKSLGTAFLGYVDSSTFCVGALNPGTYYIAVGASNTYSSQAYSITPTFIEGDARDYETENNDTLATANAVALDHLISGQAKSSADVDSYKIDVAAGGFLSIDFKSPVKDAFIDYEVGVYDATGKLIDHRGTDGRLSLVEKIATGGTYTIQVKGAAGGNYLSGNYAFVAHADTGVTPPAQSTLGMQAPLSGSLDAIGQSDWYRVNLTAGQLYEFALSGAQSGGGTLTDGALMLVDAAGHALESVANLRAYANGSTAQTADPQLAFTAGYSGVYYLRVAGYGTIGSYTLREKGVDLSGQLLSLTGVPAQHWGPTGTGSQALVVTYSFLTATADGEVGFKPMTEGQKQAVRSVLAQYSSFLNVDFKEMSNPAGAQICYGTSDRHNVSGGVELDTADVDGTLWHANVFINNTDSTNGAIAEASQVAPGQYGYEVLLHETGHALGLKHPGDYNSTGGSGIAPFIAPAWDNREFTVMSYIDNAGTGPARTPGLLDVAALQSLYGARTAAAAQLLTFNTQTDLVATAVSGSTAAILDLSGQTANCTISLTPGTFSSVGLTADGTPAHDNLAIAFGTRIAQLLAGSGDDYIIAPEGGCSINGGAGSDTVFFAGMRNNFTVAHGSNGYTVIDHAGNLGVAQLVNVEVLNFNGFSLLPGSDASVGQTLACAAGGGTVNGTPGDDIVTGSSGNDVFVAGGGNDTFFGGAGIDSLLMAGKRADFSLKSGDGIVSVSGTTAPSLDTLSGVERVRFDDVAVAFDVDGNAGQVYRLYQAAFNRKPDTPGLGFWIQFMDKGMNLTEVAASFEASAEFTGLYGINPTNGELVTLLYKNALHRDPEPAGFDFWLNILNTSQQSRATILTSFSESPENQAQVIGSIKNGMDYVYFA